MQTVAQEYKEMFEVAVEATKKSIEEFPLDKHETKDDRFSKRIIDQLEMYTARYGGVSADTTKLGVFKDIQKWYNEEGHSMTLNDYLEINIKALEKKIKESEGEIEEVDDSK